MRHCLGHSVKHVIFLTSINIHLWNNDENSCLSIVYFFKMMIQKQKCNSTFITASCRDLLNFECLKHLSQDCQECFYDHYSCWSYSCPTKHLCRTLQWIKQHSVQLYNRMCMGRFIGSIITEVPPHLDVCDWCNNINHLFLQTNAVSATSAPIPDVIN